MVCAHSLAICERGIKSLGFNTSQFNGTRMTQQTKTPHTFFHNVKDGVFNELELRKLIFFITSMIAKVFYNYWWMNYMSLLGFIYVSFHITFQKIGPSFVLSKLFSMLVQQMFFMEALPWLGFYCTNPFFNLVVFCEILGREE